MCGRFQRHVTSHIILRSSAIYALPTTDGNYHISSEVRRNLAKLLGDDELLIRVQVTAPTLKVRFLLVAQVENEAILHIQHDCSV